MPMKIFQYLKFPTVDVVHNVVINLTNNVNDENLFVLVYKWVMNEIELTEHFIIIKTNALQLQKDQKKLHLKIT
jgi:hypothetical protein